MRLDKFLSNYGIGSRSTVKNLIKKGLVKVNNQVVKNPSLKINLEKDKVYFDGEILEYKKDYYFMLNKPSGYVTAKEDDYYPVVMEFFRNEPFYEKLFPVGRLDVDTEGLLIITTDGIFAHRISHPKWEIEKEYYAKVKGEISSKDFSKFEKEGIFIEEDKYQTKPFKIEILNSSNFESEILITVKEGKYHIVKKIMKQIGNIVVYLKRIRIGSLKLDKNLKTGEFRPLTEREINSLKKDVKLI
jgi:16S rRNA pseudouridine516 synthase